MSPQIDNTGRKWISLYLDEPEGSLGARALEFVRNDLRSAAKKLDKFTIIGLSEKIGHNRQRTSSLVEKLDMLLELKELANKPK